MHQLQNTLVLLSLSVILSTQARATNTYHPVHDTTFVLIYDSIIRETNYYRNGNIKYRVWFFYNREKQEENKRIVETFWKNGTRRGIGQYMVKPERGALMVYAARYDAKGKLVLENYWAYDNDGNLIEPPPDPNATPATEP